MKKAIAVILALFLFSLLFYAFHLIPSYDYKEDKYDYTNPINGSKANESITKHYLDNAGEETGATNVVTAIVVEYRGFDTLGEVTVLFTASIGLSMLLHRIHSKGKEKRGANLIAREGSKLVLPFILLTGTYIFIHGHLTPGGGFPGGAVVASGFLLMMLSYPEFFMKKERVAVVEGIGGIVFVIIGLLGLIFATYFLQNFLPLGKTGFLLSAGIIPLIYIAIGFKVGAELSSIVNNMKEVEK